MLGRIRVLIADDLANLRTLIRTNLEFDGRFEVVGEATNGLEAVDLAQQLNPDVVVLDVAMPQMDGLTSVSKIRQCCPKTKILVLSAIDDEHHRTLARELGADGFMPKDRPMEEVVDTLAEIAGFPAPQ